MKPHEEHSACCLDKASGPVNIGFHETNPATLPIVLWVQDRTHSTPLWEVAGRKTITERRTLLLPLLEAQSVSTCSSAVDKEQQQGEALSVFPGKCLFVLS